MALRLHRTVRNTQRNGKQQTHALTWVFFWTIIASWNTRLDFNCGRKASSGTTASDGTPTAMKTRVSTKNVKRIGLSHVVYLMSGSSAECAGTMMGTKWCQSPCSILNFVKATLGPLKK